MFSEPSIASINHQFNEKNSESFSSLRDGIHIEWPADGGLSRKVVRRSNYRITGKYPSLKAGRMLHWESEAERKVMVMLDFCPAVSLFQEQPGIIHYKKKEGWHRHYPDLLVQGDGQTEFWEVKPDLEHADDETLVRSRLLEARLPAHGYHYRLVFANELARAPRLANAIRLLAYCKHSIDPLAQEQSLLQFADTPTLTWCELTASSCATHPQPTLARMILEGQLHFNTDTLLSDQTEIYWVKDQAIFKEQTWASLISKKDHG
mgnify:CR=1 FL=1